MYYGALRFRCLPVYEQKSLCLSFFLSLSLFYQEEQFIRFRARASVETHACVGVVATKICVKNKGGIAGLDSSKSHVATVVVIP